MPKMLELPTTGAYKWVNLVNGKVYVGGAYRSFDERKMHHTYCLKGNRHFNKHLQRSWNLCGEGAFEFVVLERCSPGREIVKAVEQKWLDALKAADPEHGYNSQPTAYSNFGVKFSEETKQKMSKARVGIKLSDETRAKMSAKKQGGRSPACKLTIVKVIEIREAYAAGNFSFGRLGRAFEMSGVNISAIVYGKIWKDAGGPILGG